MISAIKISGIVLSFLLILSIKVNGRHLFSYFYQVVSPATTYIQDKAEIFFGESFDSTHKYSKKLFDNSVPKVKDSVESKLSARLKKAANGEPAEEIKREEKKELDQLIKTHR